MRNERNGKKEKTDAVQKKWRKPIKAGKVQQVIEGGGVQVGACERPGRCQPSPLRKKIQVCLSERSEFLIATCKKKKTDSLCVCSANLGFSVRSANRVRPKHGIPLSV